MSTKKKKYIHTIILQGQYTFLTEKITRVLDKFAPVKTIQVKPSYAPWLTDQVKEAMTQRDRAQLTASVTQCQESWRLYRHLRNFATKCLKNAKKTRKQCSLTPFAIMQQTCGEM